MKVSFDFDGTLGREDVQEYARSLVREGHEVWIVTSRCDTERALEKGWWWVKSQNEELYEVAEECGIPIERIKFTEHIDKIVFLEGKGFAFHLDDDEDELVLIMESGDPCRPLNVGHFEWQETCNEIISNGRIHP